MPDISCARRALRPVPALAVGTVLLTSACGGTSASTSSDSDLPAAVAQSGTLRVGMSPDFPPMEYLDEKTQSIVGVDVKLVNALGRKLGVKVKIVQQSFDQLLNSVQTGRVDIVMSGLSDTAERQKTVDFVDYFASEGRFYTLQSDAGKFTKPADVCGKTLAVSKKTDYYEQVQKYDKQHCAGAGKSAVKLLPTDSGSAARLQLEQGRADVAVQGAENLAYFEKQDAGKYESVLGPLKSTPFGIVVKKGDSKMSGAILKAMKALVKDGTYKKILTGGGMDYAVTTPVLNGTKD
ncbi:MULTISPECIES: ABC transporter substrate-binding protein [Streptomyces]|uniref:Polar amino acid transport system substrate-binding protein n=2 Tax=Streptomyces TaxID=1883 RepID=A0ABT9KWB4_9ACTN|nr:MULTISPECIES: ABC transporter substrate-binding protein [Streptomyces]MBW8090817.1 ABC transporter substrate-binding protein [Streptomyces hygroscopicus subsp. hygroscopicus]MCO8307164.1 ABC transporter substrate-binding protein [Streptomyces sp. RKCA744]MDN3060354.1 ABC transporter substrate-binding protein [Streptomyces sp. SRF1]MDP9612731.1 polar amino acid transport system substrate-binding protein [Streptomyces demainii]GHJ26905.1 ABC transporter substrate-binding protein [Streptomyces